MVKSNARAAKSPSKKPRAEPSQTGGKRSGRASRKAPATTASEARSSASDDGADELPSDALALKVPARVVWDKYPERTERLLDYLDAHQDVAIKLFRDSMQAAKVEGRSKLTTKSNKGAAYLQVAEGIFSVDENPAVRADFKSNPSKYSKAVDNYITNT